MTLGSRIKHYRTAKNLTQKQVADYLNLTKNAITAWEKDRSAPSVGNMRQLVKILDVTMADLLDGNDERTQSPNNQAAPKAKPRKQDQKTDRLKVPIRGYAQGNFIDVGNAVKKPIGFLDLAPSFSNIVDLYAVYITGDSMSPAHNSGDTRLVTPHTPCKIGDTVVIVKKASGDKPETSYIKIYSEKRTLASGKVMLHFTQHNPPAELIFDETAVVQMHKVLTYNELLGL